MFFFLKDIWKRITQFKEVEKELQGCKKYIEKLLLDMNKLIQRNKKLKIYGDRIMEELYPKFDDKIFWNSKWERENVYYNAPNRKIVKDYVRFQSNPLLEKEYKKIIETYNIDKTTFKIGTDMSSLIVKYCTKWLCKKFDNQCFTYVSDKSERWNLASETLESGKGDCDDYGILLYDIIRGVFRSLGIWEENKHRLKCVAGNVNHIGLVPSVNGGHFYLNWLDKDSQWYTVETTYHRKIALDNFMELPQKYNPMYGVIWFTFNQDICWSQNSIAVSKKDYKKNKK